MGSTVAPDDQTVLALKMGNEVKRKRPKLLSRVQSPDVKANLRYAADVMEDIPELLKSMGVLNFLDAINGVEFEEAEAWMKELWISGMASMRALRDDQRKELGYLLRAKAEGAPGMDGSNG